MSKLIAVIGANYGDEGKGYMTDYFCSEAKKRGESVINLLGNGGGQRGHTVEETDGKRFVFHHLGAGSMTGTDQYFSPDYLINPIIFLSDYEEFFKLYQERELPTPVFNLYMSPECRFSTPFDMMANQIIELCRGEKRHGSVGVGIWETVRRYEKGHGITVREMKEYTREEQEALLKQVKEYQEERLQKKLGISPCEMPEWNKIWNHPNLIPNYLDDFDQMNRMVQMVPLSELSVYDTIVVENAQGILLTQDRYDGRNNTTPSDTGAKEIAGLMKKGLVDAVKEIRLCYVTRSYITKHGAGYLEGECDSEEIAAGIVDHTNVPNPFQGTIRYAKMNEAEVIRHIREDEKDLAEYPHQTMVSITHLNEAVPRLNLFLKEFDQVYVSDRKEREGCILRDKNAKII